jgi:8-oxo-dGTP pyrophosphatase MutT (NUDIX family)
MKLYRSIGLVVYTVHNSKIEYLLLHYPHGHWDFAKGKMEPGESEIETAIRELYEETGLAAQIDDNFKQEISYYFIDKDSEKAQKNVCFMIGYVAKRDIELSHEHIGYEWLPCNDAYLQLTFDNAKNVLVKADVYIRENSEII